MIRTKSIFCSRQPEGGIPSRHIVICCKMSDCGEVGDEVDRDMAEPIADQQKASH